MVFDSYRTVFLQKRAQVLPVDCKDWSTVHCISPLLSGLAVKVTCNAAMDRVLAAQLLVRRLE